MSCIFLIPQFGKMYKTAVKMYKPFGNMYKTHENMYKTTKNMYKTRFVHIKIETNGKCEVIADGAYRNDYKSI